MNGMLSIRQITGYGMELLLLVGGIGVDYGRVLATEPTVAPSAVSGAPRTAVIALDQGINLEFMLILPDTFIMGPDKSTKEERPVHPVTLTQPFYLGKYEVTQEQWQIVMDSNPSKNKGTKHPVEKVSWQDCQKFLENLNQKYGRAKAPVAAFRLPTEEEWEYACRAGTTTAYCFGDAAAGLAEYGWYNANCSNSTQAVGGKKPNAWGLYDMHGNVWEWCQDWKAVYAPAEPGISPAPQGGDRAVRGGSWYFSADWCKSTSRLRLGTGNHLIWVGFRILGECTASGKAAGGWRPLYPDPAAAGQ